ncbi:NADH-dependent flavin oxidoreductase [Paenibacillus sp. JDR-2]|uniref:NADH-dependent flavin oxidoreductase n=1 Tax=Paenibacillus sp. (strain JDR-2) TaxID=324057 RepID=UPI00016153EC|nr:NADH-dependent flavin oxidoreductase [Paenibacillus sp. JDR-2]ABV90488.1 NADH-dependent flavin oxidoreductase [Paenibacillus sp. JDR-2]ACT00002.1 NADH:flavin oxidoreductase/NADH oxidase [Paenibacillus sp. JDR-2]
MEQNYKPLFESFTFPSGVEVKNRIVMAPMTHSSSNDDGTVTDAELEYYARRSEGAGMVITACIYVTPNGKGFPGEFAGDSDAMIPGLARLAETIKARGAKAILQIFHGGRRVPPALVPNGDVVSASAVAATESPDVVPRELKHEEIEAIIRDFGETTRRAALAGFDGVEIHGANTYLLQQFYSPHSNRRNDQWGGDIDRRLTFPLAVVDEVKRAAAEHAKGPFLVGYRFSPEEPETPGLTMEDTFRLLDELAQKDLDYLHVSLFDFRSKPSRGADDSKTRLEWVAERVAGRVPVIGVGSINSADDAIEAQQTGIPLVAIGRVLLTDPDWVQKVETGREDEIQSRLSLSSQKKLVIPDGLWRMLTAREGWLPFTD